MKKLTFVTTALLCCSLAYSQEVDVRIIPRVDVNALVPTSKESDWGVDFGNTSLYTLVEGTFAENFSYSIANHWLSVPGISGVGEEIAGLYTGSLYSNANNWLDWANLTYTLSTENAGSFEFTAGKDVMAIGGFELDAYDFDSHFGLSSLFWNYGSVYQWGGKVGYTTPSEMSSFYFQATTSPYGGMLFRDRQYGAYGLMYRGEYDWYAPIFSTNFIQYDRNRYMNVIALGNQFYAGDCTIGIDWMNRARSARNFFNQEMSLMGTLSYNFGDKVELFGKVGWERFKGDGFFSMPTLGQEDAFGLYTDYCAVYEPLDGETLIAYEPLPENYIWGGIGVNWYPVKDSQDLRVHALISTNNIDGLLTVGIGVTYNFSVFSK